jgi:hypothetical protein
VIVAPGVSGPSFSVLGLLQLEQPATVETAAKVAAPMM